MKKLLFVLCISLTLKAQNDSLKIDFSEEKIEQFEKTNLIDEYEKAFGGNKVVKNALRFRLDNSINKSSGYFLQYERKLGNSLSLIGSFSGGYSKFSGFQHTFGGETRWYYGMQNRINQDKQKANITGNFLSVKGTYYPHKLSDQPYIRIDETYGFVNVGSFFNPVFIHNAAVNIQYGKQLGNTIEFGITGGLKHGKEYTNQQVNWIYVNPNFPEPYLEKARLSPFLATFTQIGIGFMFPRKGKLENNNCEFLKCNYEVNRMFKLNLNDAIYLDKYVQRAKVDLGYEERLGKSNFSVNTSLSAGFISTRTLEAIKLLDTLVIRDGKSYPIKAPIFSGKNINDITFTTKATSQLKYYLKKNSMNLNGIYTGVAYSFMFEDYTKGNLAYTPVSRSVNIFNGIIGYQTQTSLGSFIDINGALGLESINFRSISNNELQVNKGFKQVHFEVAVKLGLAR